MVRLVAKKSRLGEFWSYEYGQPNFTAFAANGSRGPTRQVYEPGGQAMWIVLYVAMIGSFKAMGLAPDFNLESDDNRIPDDDI
jgi:hypothetical protein